MTVSTSRLTHLDGSDPRPFRHLPALDGVRAMAIVFVILLHYSSPWRRGEYGLFAGGYIGVDVFFVLSGFLITSLLLGEQARRGAVSFAAFYARRGLRLLPALVVFLIAHVIFVQLINGDMAVEVKSIVVIVLYVSNYAQATGFDELVRSSLSFSWSLSIEEHFYFVWPSLLVLVLLRRITNRRALFGVLLGAAAVSAAVRTFFWLVQDDYLGAYFRTESRVDGLLIGAAAAFLWRWRLVPTRYLNHAATISLVALVLVALFSPKPGDAMFTFGFTGVSLAAAIIVLAIAEDSWSLTPIFASLPMRALGRVSYGTYLWHGLSLRIAFRSIEYDYGKWVLVAVAALISVSAVTLSWFLIEQPALRLKRRFERVSLASEALRVAR